MPIRFYTLDVFTEQRFGGNPLAVIPEAGALTDALMQKIAREFNLSETVFILPPSRTGALRRLRIFTPSRELPFAGHPTIGTACLLGMLGQVPFSDDQATFTFEEAVGPIEMTLHRRGNAPPFAWLTAARLPEPGPPPPASGDLAALLSLKPSDILAETDRPEAYSCGVPFLFIPVRDRQVLGRVQLIPALWQRHLAHYWAPQIYVFCKDPELPCSSLRARMFAPQLGVVEDPATGAAVAAMAGYLAGRAPQALGTLKWTLEQGFEMGRPSLLHLETDRVAGHLQGVRVGGAAVLMSEGTLYPAAD